jgi:hypothetical protein
MPRDDLTVDMNARGGRETRREIDKTGRSARNLGKDFKGARDDTNLFERALRLLGTRLGMIIILGSLAGVALGPTLIASIVLLTAALVTLGAVVGGVFIVGLAVVQRWSDTVKSAGSAAYELNQAFQGLRRHFAKLTAAGADMVMRSLAKALKILAPLMDQLAPSFNMFAASLATAIEYGAQTLSTLGPDLAQLFIALGPLVQQAATAMGPLANILISVGTAGIPVLKQLVAWIVDLADWLNPAIDRVIAWEQNSHTLWGTLQTFGAVVASIAGTIADLAGIFVQLYQQSQPFWEALGGIALTGLTFLQGAISWLNDNMPTLGPIILGAAAGLAVLVGTVWLFNTAMGVLTALLAVNPLVWLALAIGAVIAGLIVAYQKVTWFRNGVDWLVQALKDAANWIKTAFGAAIDFVVPKIMWLIDKIKWIVDKASTVTGFAGKVLKYSPYGVATQGLVKGAHALGLQSGGTVTRGGAFQVGEAGPEMVTLPAGAAVTPHGGGDVYVHATLVMPDGQVLARQTLRAARRKQSVS